MRQWGGEFLGKLRSFFAQSVFCCRRNAFLESHNYSMSSSSAVESYFNNRHERSMVRLCALLWVLKIQDERYTNQQMQSTTTTTTESTQQSEPHSSEIAGVVSSKQTVVSDKCWLDQLANCNLSFYLLFTLVSMFVSSLLYWKSFGKIFNDSVIQWGHLSLVDDRQACNQNRNNLRRCKAPQRCINFSAD